MVAKEGFAPPTQGLKCPVSACFLKYSVVEIVSNLTISFNDLDRRLSNNLELPRLPIKLTLRLQDDDQSYRLRVV